MLQVDSPATSWLYPLPAPSTTGARTPEFGGELVRRAQAGDAEAITALYQQHAPRLQRYFLGRLGGRLAVAEDLTAEVFVRAIERLGEYQERGLPFGAWLFRVARNLLADQHRASAGAGLVGLEACEQVDEPAAERALEQVIDRQDLARALRRLTAEQREVLELRFVRGYSIAETQAVTGRTEESVKKLQARALQRLREWLLIPPREPERLLTWAGRVAVG